MDKINEIAVRRTLDPMQIIIDCLFKKNGEVLISNEILELIKQKHSYTMMPKGNNQVYTFRRRVRGTDTVFSFLVTTGVQLNKASNLEYTNEWGVSEMHIDLPDAVHETKICVMLLGE